MIYLSILEFKDTNPPNLTTDLGRSENSRKKKKKLKMSRKFPFMKSIEDVTNVDLNGTHSPPQYQVCLWSGNLKVRQINIPREAIS